ncbi:hypothetical protein CTAYLR_006747 [Chrysophaeum taylorii]|uniref:Ubiquitin carboxyl-terminal hydrolase n=1 Tax=Chrysophaeum taylorii TaxID=2483200 RepID=A0AAD7UBE3_9STRA|nr:hypothetical protein CTAYLR_006747 [Chrysophaeum taylorii]
MSSSSSRVVLVKWSNELYEVAVPDNSAASLKQEVERRTGVPVARQKLLAKGAWAGILKDSGSLEKLKPSQAVTLIGSAEVVVPKEQPKFVEDMGEAEQAKSGLTLPAGLANLGNTCYMNSTLQCLRSIPELRRRLEGATTPGDVTTTLAATYRALDSSTKPVPPASLVRVLRATFPQFAQRGRNGGFAQQDAEELYSTLIAELATKVDVDSLFGLEMSETLSCSECEAEPRVTRTDKARKLVCNIQGGLQSKKIDHLHEGLKLALSGTVDKRSEILGRDAIWTKTQTISRLAPYLTVQFMRFFWKPTPGNDDHAGVKCKIMRPVAFPKTLDVYDFCDDNLQKTLKFNRDKFGAKHKLGEDDDDDDAMEDDDLQAAIALSMSDEASSPPAFPEGFPDGFMGEYDLFAIVTHKGRSADGGHYMGWVRQGTDDDNDDNNDAKWLVFDDDLVSESTTEYVMNLKGGGDDHMAYLLLYRAKKPSKPASSSSSSSS